MTRSIIYGSCIAFQDVRTIQKQGDCDVKSQLFEALHLILYGFVRFCLVGGFCYCFFFFFNSKQEVFVKLFTHLSNANFSI